MATILAICNIFTVHRYWDYHSHA